MPTIVFSPTINWYWMKQRPQYLAEVFCAHGWHAYYCENRPGVGGFLTAVAPRLQLVGDRDRLVREILPAAPRPHILWHSRAKGSRTLSRWKHDLEVYDCLDEFPRHARDERRLVRRVDLVFASSARLAERMRGLHPHVTLVRNACDCEPFEVVGSAMPDRVPSAEVCYVGAIAPWVDVKLLYELVALRPDLRFRIVGPVLRGRPLRLPSNAEMMGHVSHDSIPALLARALVGIVPFGSCPTSLSADPIKVYEYFAAGVPVVSTPIPEVARWGDLVHLAVDAAGFSQAIDQAITGDTPALRQLRRSVARRNTWLHRFCRIDAVLRRTGAMTEVSEACTP